MIIAKYCAIILYTKLSGNGGHKREIYPKTPKFNSSADYRRHAGLQHMPYAVAEIPFNLQHATYISLGLGAVSGAILGSFFDKKKQKENRQ